MENKSLNFEDRLLYSLTSICQTFDETEIRSLDESQTFNQTGWDLLTQTGILNFKTDENLFFATKLKNRFSTLGYHCYDNGLSFAIGAHFLASVMTINAHGSKDLKDIYIESLLNGKSICANAITERDKGSDVFDMKTIAHKNEKGYVINGEKIYISNAPCSNLILVYASTDQKKGMMGGTTAFLLKADSKGIEIKRQEKMGVRTCQMGRIVFKNVQVRREDILGKEGGGGMIFYKSMIWERVGISAIHLGTIRREIDKVIVFANEKEIKKGRLSQLTVISHTIADIYAAYMILESLLNDISEKLDKGIKVDVESSVLKLKVSESYKSSMSKIMQIYGSYGFTENHRIQRCVRDAHASTIYTGTSEIHKNLIARKIGLK